MADIPDKYSDLDFVPPKAAQENAQKALDWRDEHGRDEVEGGTRVGWIRANQLAKGQELSPDIVDRMAQFNRHRQNSEIADEYEGEPWKDKGYLAWNLWGGDEGVDWAIGMAEKMDERDKQQNESADPYNNFLSEKASAEYCKNTDPSDMGFSQRASCKAQGYIERSDGTRRKSDKYKNEKKLREVIRQYIRETVFDREVEDFKSKSGNERLKIFNSSTAKIIFYKDSDSDNIYFRVLNKISGNFSDKIYLDDAKKLRNALDTVNVVL